MSRVPHNIERSAFRRGEYVAYAPDGTCRVLRGGEGWRIGGRVNGTISVATGTTARTLSELGAKLEQHKEPQP